MTRFLRLIDLMAVSFQRMLNFDSGLERISPGRSCLMCQGQSDSPSYRE